MKIALKYGLLITAVVVGWIVIVRFVMDVGADSKANLLAPLIFNVAAIVAILLGIRERKKELNGALRFKEGLKTGMKISLVYAVSACLFFMVEFLVAGPKLLLSEAGPQSGPLWQVAAMAYAGLFFGSLISGLIYSTIISFIIVRRMPRESNTVI
jgi:membrane protease YdiL (CAAX protease family)